MREGQKGKVVVEKDQQGHNSERKDRKMYCYSYGGTSAGRHHKEAQRDWVEKRALGEVMERPRRREKKKRFSLKGNLFPASKPPPSQH